MIFHAPPLAKLMRHPECRIADVTMCAFGTKYRKATNVALWFLNPAPFVKRMCTGKCCKYSQRKHVVLQGQLTALAAVYPKRFAAAAAGILLNGGVSW